MSGLVREQMKMCLKQYRGNYSILSISTEFKLLSHLSFMSSSYFKYLFISVLCQAWLNVR